MGGFLRDASPGALVTAIEANQFAFFKLNAGWPRAEMHDDPEMLWTVSDIPFPLFNSVLRARLADDRVEAAIEAAIARCRARGVPLAWGTGPATRPADLGARLVAHEFSDEGSHPGMAAELAALNEGPAPPPGLTIERVGDGETLRTLGEVMREGFEMPGFVIEATVDFFYGLGLAADLPLRHYVGWLDGVAVGAASMLLAAGVAGIYNVTTVPDARGQGVGSAMTLAPLLEARAAGWRIGILHASQMGLGVYRRLGFREYCELGEYVWQAGEALPR